MVIEYPHICGRYSAYQLVFGYEPGDLISRDNKDEDSLFAKHTSSSGESVGRWKLRAMAQEAALKGVASSKLRRLFAYGLLQHGRQDWRFGTHQSGG